MSLLRTVAVVWIGATAALLAVNYERTPHIGEGKVRKERTKPMADEEQFQNCYRIDLMRTGYTGGHKYNWCVNTWGYQGFKPVRSGGWCVRSIYIGGHPSQDCPGLKL